MRLADIAFESGETSVVARVTGEIDMSNADSIRSALADAMPNQKLLLIFDLSALDYLDSAGIQLIYQLREQLRARGQSLRLVIPASSASHDAIRLAGLAPHLEMAETVEDARRDAAA